MSINVPAFYFPERELDAFTSVDGTNAFYLLVKALYPAKQAPRILDFGAGRGAWLEDDTSRTRRSLRDLRTNAAEVVACDIDEAVLQNRCSDRQIVCPPDASLPFDDEYFDMIVADYVFEHIVDPARLAADLLRVLKPGGWICARTVNRYGYVAIASSLIPNMLHGRILGVVQTGRKEIDVFPTTHALCTTSAIRKFFAGCKVVTTTLCPEPSYYFNRRWIFALELILHRFLPSAMAPVLLAFIRK